jgi:hypothetical protein
MGKGEVVSVNKNKEVCSCKDQFLAASEQIIINRSFILWDMPISQCWIGDVLSEKIKWENSVCGYVKKIKGEQHDKLEEALTILLGL